MNRLPDAETRAFPADAHMLLGWAEVVGKREELEEMLRPKGVSNHPWLGLEVAFPFPEVGRGKIIRCMTHPRGSLMFDVEFPTPVPPIHTVFPYDGKPGYCELRLKGVMHLYSGVLRFYAEELRGIVNGEWMAKI